jgi:hypothetical protein
MKQLQTNRMSLRRKYLPKTRFWANFGPKWPYVLAKICGQYKKPPLIVNQSECAISDKSNEFESRYLLKSLSIIMCKISKIYSRKCRKPKIWLRIIQKWNLETKIIWRQLNISRARFFLDMQFSRGVHRHFVLSFSVKKSWGQ